MVSFVIPVYNAVAFLEATINSVLDCGYDDVELILADDGSSDGSQDICFEFMSRYPNKVRHVQHDDKINKGVSATRQLAITKASGEFIFFLDADDALLPGIIPRYIAIFSSHPEVVLIHGSVNIISEVTPHFDIGASFDFGNRDILYDLSADKNFLVKNYICNSTVCVRKLILENVNFQYDQAFQVEDWVLWTLLAEKGKYFYISSPVINYRYHPTSATYQVGKRGYIYHNYTLIEYYYVIAIRASRPTVRKKASDLLYVHLGMLQKFYSKGKGPKLSGILLTSSFFKDLVKTLLRKQ